MLEHLKKLYKKEKYVFFTINAFVEDWDEDFLSDELDCEFENSSEERDIAILREFLDWVEKRSGGS